jgi:hypothetical protein
MGQGIPTGPALIASRVNFKRSIAKDSIAVVVALVPVTLGAPAVFVLVPPAMLLAPATLSRRVQLATLVIGLAAVAAMALDGLVEFVLGVSDAALAAVDIVRLQSRHSGNHQDSGQEDSRERGNCNIRELMRRLHGIDLGLTLKMVVPAKVRNLTSRQAEA